MEDYISFSDDQLQRLAVSGDSRAEDVLVRRYSWLVMVCSRPYYLAGGDKNDLLQEGMLGVLSAIREFSPEKETSFRSFAELCIQRHIFTAIRSAARKKNSPLNDGVSLEEAFGNEEHTSGVHQLIPEFRRTPEEQVLARESADEFFQCVSRLLSPFEKSILRYYLDGFSYKSIAAQCGRDEKSVDNAVQRIRRKLAQATQSGDSSDS